ncbi:MAG: hypothetical protein KGQ60_00415 [Planctomycetes bacterium]|nr:hypothetical protein [Planctomycetota bacterium]
MAPRLAFCILILTWIGCSQPRVPVSDLAAAKSMVEKVMESWKSGASIDEFRQSSGIIVSEDLWKRGQTLLSYQMKGEGEMLGPNVRFRITLSCSDKSGKKSERTFNYLVTTVPEKTFFREEGS